MSRKDCNPEKCAAYRLQNPPVNPADGSGSEEPPVNPADGSGGEDPSVNPADGPGSEDPPVDPADGPGTEDPPVDPADGPGSEDPPVNPADGSDSLFDQLMSTVGPMKESSGSKVTVVGSGMVGMAAAFGLLTMHVASDVALVDMMEDKVKGEVMDLQHGSMFVGNVKVTGSSDFAITADSRICIITAGVRQQEGESRLDLVQRNTEVLRGIVPELVKYSPDTILIVVSNPVDILTYVAWKLSGLPKNRVIGSGTNLDSSRFRFMLSSKFNVGPTSCHGWIIGEHGDSSVPVWSGVNIAGVRLREINPSLGTADDPDNWAQIHKDVVNSAYEVIKLKGFTNWAIALSVVHISRAILRNSCNVQAVSTLVQGVHGIETEVFFSLPCVLGENGVTYIVKQTLEEDELAMLHQSADLMWDVQSKLEI